MGLSAREREHPNALSLAIEERDRLRRFAEWVAGYESERQLVGSGVIEHAKEVLDD